MVNIRKYSPGLQRAVKTFVLGILTEFGFKYDPALDFDLDNPQKFYPGSGGVFLVARESSKVVGTIAVKIKDGVPILKRFYVDKKHRGKGIGGRLFDQVIAFCRKNKFRKITLDTNNKFCDAFEMYKKKGFKTVSKDVNPSCSSCTCHIYMEKEL